MKTIHWLALITTSSVMLLSSCDSRQTFDQSSSASSSLPPQPISYQTHTLENTVIHTVSIPNYSTPLKSQVVTIALETELTTLENFAQKYQAIAAINGVFFDPNNQKTTSYIIQDGELTADPRNNERLVENSNLEPYMEKILNRSEFRRYSCTDNSEGNNNHQLIRYDIVPHTATVPKNCQLVDSLGAGPAILPEDTSFEEGFVDYDANGEVIRDALGSKAMNARSAVGITEKGTVIFAMAAQKPEKPRNSGINLPDFAAFLKTLGVEKAMNLDGGSSASMYYQGKAIYGRVDGEGNAIQRPIKSVLIVY